MKAVEVHLNKEVTPSQAPSNGPNEVIKQSSQDRQIGTVDIADLLVSVKKIEEYLVNYKTQDGSGNQLFFPNEKSQLYVWLKKTYKGRLLREQFFNSEYFGGEAAWNMILDLAVARLEEKRISISSACIASGVPPTTALRWINVLESDGIIDKECDSSDKRRTFLKLSDKGMNLIVSFFKKLDDDRIK